MYFLNDLPALMLVNLLRSPWTLPVVVYFSILVIFMINYVLEMYHISLERIFKEESIYGIHSV